MNNLDNWTREENSVLNYMNEYTQPKEIFQAVCNEIGRYFVMKGAKYTKSRPRLKFNGKKLRCEFGLWSSCSNTAGQWINLEVVTSVYAIYNDGMARKGILNYSPRPKNFNVYKINQQMFADIIKYIEETLELVWSFECKTGLDKYLSDTNTRYRSDNPNDNIYYKSL